MNRARLRRMIAGPLAGGGGAAPVETLTLQPSSTTGQDTYLNQDDPDVNAGNATLFSVDGSDSLKRHALIKFDLSTLAGKAIVSSELTLWSTAGMPNPGTFNAHRVLAGAAWTETGATWNTRNGVDAWPGAAGCSSPGTDYATVAMGVLETAGEAAGTPLVFSLDPGDFATMVAANHGLVIVYPQSGAIGFRACENATALQRPKLVVTYTN